MQESEGVDMGVEKGDQDLNKEPQLVVYQRPVEGGADSMRHTGRKELKSRHI